eukprot:2483642-Prymnesium_polylepis.1
MPSAPYALGLRSHSSSARPDASTCAGAGASDSAERGGRCASTTAGAAPAGDRGGGALRARDGSVRGACGCQRVRRRRAGRPHLIVAWAG